MVKFILLEVYYEEYYVRVLEDKFVFEEEFIVVCLFI